MYEKECFPYQTGLEGFHLDTPVVWRCLKNHREVTLSGRLIGGCLDCLVSLVGTRFDYVEKFINRYQDDGILWYFDDCELTIEKLVCALWQLKEVGWFRNASGILFGRTIADNSAYDISFCDALKQSLGDLEIEVLYDLDFGHFPPSMTLVNGAMAEVHFYDGSGEIELAFL